LGSIVQIDPRVRKIAPGGWHTKYERPIYFVELRTGYCRCWCEFHDRAFWLLPHPLSPCKVRRLASEEVEIVGQVTGAGVRFTNAKAAPPHAALALTKSFTASGAKSAFRT